MTWNSCRIGDVLTLKRGHDLPNDERQAGDIPVVSSSGITGFHSVSKAQPPGVVTGRYGTLGQVFYVEEPYWPLNTALYVVDFKGTHPRFAAYFLKNALAGYRSDKAAVPGVDRNVLHDLRVRAPDPTLQERIADILSSYDNLIENNSRRMTLLEESARLLYREWFVRLRFPGYEHTRIVDGVPDGWERGTLGERITLHYGKALKAEDRVEGGFPVYGSSGIVGTHDRALVKGPGLIVGRKGNVGSVFWSSTDYWPIDTVYYVDAENSDLYLFYALMHAHFSSTDVAVPGLNRDFAHSRQLLVPPEYLKRQFLEIVGPIYEQLDKLTSMNQKLRAARDLLLPKLMSGELAV